MPKLSSQKLKIRPSTEIALVDMAKVYDSVLQSLTMNEMHKKLMRKCKDFCAPRMEYAKGEIDVVFEVRTLPEKINDFKAMLASVSAPQETEVEQQEQRKMKELLPQKMAELYALSNKLYDKFYPQVKRPTPFNIEHDYKIALREHHNVFYDRIQTAQQKLNARQH
jgi:hypothetical protein